MPPTPWTPERSTGVSQGVEGEWFDFSFVASAKQPTCVPLAECFLTELEQRNAKQGALLEDRTFHALVDSTEVALDLAFRYDNDRVSPLVP
ncbi:hypothetical protein AK812_SmicGene26345 [Symbiodinium microadriaticum]|uniref:Uncharacterized protein n=1 Tax=Symbiodinium microadriaticum TaxID=2951 RepID=A0A1Q9D9L6_SYMMI|nr:hypothetical protein AK812_SmicGene26345 [Symbiodinium microadriaticum]